MKKIKTKLYSALLDQDICLATYVYLKENIEWEDGIRSKKGFTRKAKPMTLGEDEVLDSIIDNALSKIYELESTDEFRILGIYLNYYRNGEDYTPNHTHPGQKQIVISLGATRTLITGKKKVELSNGDVIIFGSVVHGIPKDQTCQDGRISIALFIQK